MATTIMEQQQKNLLKKFHTLLGKARIDEDGKEAILSGYGVSSSKDLTAYELLEVCNKLEKMADPELAEQDRWRKRLIASIFEYRKAMGAAATMQEVKAIACRAAEVKDFNKITIDRLRSLYNAFNKQTKDLKRVQQITRNTMEISVILN